MALTFTDAHGGSVAGSTSVVTTPEHPFRVASGEWVAAGRLDIGDNIVTAEGSLATLSACPDGGSVGPTLINSQAKRSFVMTAETSSAACVVEASPSTARTQRRSTVRRLGFSRRKISG